MQLTFIWTLDAVWTLITQSLSRTHSFLPRSCDLCSHDKFRSAERLHSQRAVGVGLCGLVKSNANPARDEAAEHASVVSGQARHAARDQGWRSHAAQRRGHSAQCSEKGWQQQQQAAAGVALPRADTVRRGRR